MPPGPAVPLSILDLVRAVRANPAEAREFLAIERARADYGEFLLRCWRLREPFIPGSHLEAIAERLTRAVADLRRGLSTYLLIQMPIRHGKSECCTIHFVPWFLGVMRAAGLDPDVIVSGYGADLAETFSRRAQGVIRSPAYRAVFPGVELDKEATGKWTLRGSQAGVLATGLGGALPGHGAALAILDDFCKSRLEAESQVQRDTAWAFFSEGLMTRLAPASIVLIPATPWHVDDVAGRIESAMSDDRDFPRFETMRFPARGGDGAFLWEERMGREWYLRQYAQLGTYSAAALLDCNPRQKGLSLFREEDFRAYPAPGIAGPPERVNRYLVVDYAGSDAHEACEAVILQHCIDAEGLRWFEGVEHGRWGAGELTHRIVRAILRCKPLSVGLEQGAALVLARWLAEECRRNRVALLDKERRLRELGRDLAVVPEGFLRTQIHWLRSPAGSGSPEAGKAKLRIEELQGYYQDGRILHNAAWGLKALERQLLAYPSRPDDIADAAAYSLQQARQPGRDVEERPWHMLTFKEQREARLKAAVAKQDRRRREMSGAGAWVVG